MREPKSPFFEDLDPLSVNNHNGFNLIVGRCIGIYLVYSDQCSVHPFNAGD